MESEIHIRILLFFGRLIAEPKMAPAVKNLFTTRVDSFLNSNVRSICVIAYKNESLCKVQAVFLL